jgi:prepilin-type N-terminal cleavage/methylation domain-containing protein
MTRARTPSRRGFTLVEVVTNLAVASILLLSIGSAMMVVARSLPTGRTEPELRAAAAAALDAVAADLETAVSVVSASDRRVSVTVPDRDSDGKPEELTFTWDGSSGGLLERVVNGGKAETLAAGVRDFALGYHRRLVTTTTTNDTAAGDEVDVLRIGRTGAVDFALTGLAAVGVSFLPALPGGTTSWTVARVSLPLAPSGAADGVFALQVRGGDATTGAPNGAVLVQLLINESSIKSAGVYDFTLPSPVSFNPGDRACVVLRHVSGSVSALTMVQKAGQVPARTALVTSADGGATFTVDPTSGLVCRVTGTIAAPVSSTTTRAFLDGVSFTLRLGRSSSSAATGRVATVNAPEVQP